MPYTRRPFNYTGTLPNQVENDLGLADDNFDILAQAFVNDDPASGVVKNADMLDGFHASQTPAPNVILPLNANGRIYNYVAYGAMRFDPPDFTMSNNTEYFIGSVSITTPSWSPSGVWKAIFVVTSWFHSAAGGVNNFQHRVKTANGFTNLGAYWFWNTPYSGSGMGVRIHL